LGPAVKIQHSHIALPYKAAWPMDDAYLIPFKDVNRTNIDVFIFYLGQAIVTF
jgi:hypothetical protein